ncbi:MAG: hypothetical protein FWH41_05410 [Treponema sp.]|nr:hypothetical protein [Treponema sp.]
MSEENKKKRPNENYQLSHQKTDKDGIIYYYDRERRLSKASQSVRDLYKEEPPRRFNLLRPLMNSRPKAFMFISIVVICGFMFALSFLGYLDNSYQLEGNHLDIKAYKHEDIIFISLKKTIPKSITGRLQPAYSGNVDISVTARMDSQQNFFHNVYFSSEPVESHSFTIPFYSDELLVVLQSEKETLRLMLKPE